MLHEPRPRLPLALQHCAAKARHLRLTAVVALALCGALLGGCVTTESGGLPAPASKDRRVQAQLALARLHLSERDFDQARPPLEKAIEIDPNAVEAYVLYAALSNGEGEPVRAEKYYKKAIKLDPSNAQGLSNYGAFLVDKGRADEAVPILKRAVQDPAYLQRSQAYENLGLASLKTGDTEGAQRAFVRAVSLERSQARSNLELAAMAHAAGDHVNALELYNNFRKNARQTPRSLCLGMQINAGLGDQDGVSSYALALKNLYPNSRQAKSCPVE